MDRLLEELRAAGDRVEEGEFSIDLEAATRKLGLMLAMVYPLELVAASVAAGAREVKLRLGRRSVSLEAPGARLTEAELRQVAESPLAPSAGAAARHLARGWLGASARGACSALLERGHTSLTWSPQGRGQAVLSPQDCTWAVLDLPKDGLTATFWSPRPPWYGLPCSRAWEHYLLYNFVRLSPVPVRVDGAGVNAAALPSCFVLHEMIPCPSIWRLNTIHKSHILVERNLLARAGSVLAAPLPVLNTVRNLRLGERAVALGAGDSVRHRLDLDARCVNLAEWRFEEGPQPEWPLTRVQRCELVLDLADYPLARATNFFGTHTVLTVPQEAVQPHLGQLTPFNLGFTLRGLRRPLPLVWARLYILMDLEGSGWLQVVRHGVSLEPVALELGCPGGVALVADDDSLTTDLSGMQVVEDEALERLRLRLVEQFRQMTEQCVLFLEAYPDWVQDYVRRGLGARSAT